MAFSDTDPLEEIIGVRCEDMTPEQLVEYITLYHKAFDIDMFPAGRYEKDIFSFLQKVYGKKNAGLIVKWCFYKHRGLFRGEPISYNIFSSRCKWFTDKMFIELQRDTKKTSAKTTTAFEGRGLADL